LLNNHPELQESPVWVYFHSNIPEYNKVECWGPLWEAMSQHQHDGRTHKKSETLPELPCPDECKCCFPTVSTIPWSHRHYQHTAADENVADGLLEIPNPGKSKG